MGNRNTTDLEDRWENEAIRRYETRAALHEICRQAEIRDQATRRVEMQLRFLSVKGSKLA